MRCYACDVMIDQGLDKATGRFYCSPCMEPTSRVILSQKQKELDAFMLGFDDSVGMSRIFLQDDPEVEEDIQIYLDREDEYHENEYD